MIRSNGRGIHTIREVEIYRHYLKHAEGSVLIKMGDTKVICSASVDDGVPGFLKNTGRGWVTAEYGMLPRSTIYRHIRESTQGRVGGRTHEIQRLIGRSLRAITDLVAFGEKTIWIDCDVIQADGGTRTASITGSFIALWDAFNCMVKEGRIDKIPINDSVAAISVGKVNDHILLDLDYEEDSKAIVDMNFVMTGRGKFIEVQGTAEKTSFSKDELMEMTALAWEGIKILTKKQEEVLKTVF